MEAIAVAPLFQGVCLSCRAAEWSSSSSILSLLPSFSSRLAHGQKNELLQDIRPSIRHEVKGDRDRRVEQQRIEIREWQSREVYDAAPLPAPMVEVFRGDLVLLPFIPGVPLVQCRLHNIVVSNLVLPLIWAESLALCRRLRGEK